MTPSLTAQEPVTTRKLLRRAFGRFNPFCRSKNHPTLALSSLVQKRACSYRGVIYTVRVNDPFLAAVYTRMYMRGT